MSDLFSNPKTYQDLIALIAHCLTQGRLQAAQQVNTALLETYWQIGRYIIKFEQAGQERAEYGSQLLAQLSKDLKASHGKGFSRRNVLDMRRFYLTYPKWQTLSAKLSWSHYTELLSISDELARSFYEQQSLKENVEDDNKPIGIVLAKDKDEILVEYATGSISNQLFVSRYQIYLPDKAALQQEI
jgi:DUF1016 N-terminal domain/YhcG PDDEXK nuclease domain